MNADEPRDPSIDAAYRATARDAPPRALDERILAAAHRAVDARPAPLGRSFAQRWRVPVALAATVVLSATITLMVYESERSPLMQEELGPGKVLREDRAAPAAAPPPRPAEKESGAREAKPSEVPERGRVESQTAVPRRAPPEAEDVRRQLESAKPDQRMSNEAPPAPFPAERTRPAAPPSADAPRAKDGQGALDKKREAPATFRSETDEIRPAPAPAPMPQGARREPSVGSAAPSSAAPEPPAAATRERALADRPAGRTERDAAAAAPAALRSPEDWIAEIRRLKEAGRSDDAKRLLVEFRERFPDLPIPEDLR